MSQPTVSKFLTDFVDLQKIKSINLFTYQELPGRVPGALECVDGKHIPIVSPVEGKYAYVNWKNFHSNNAQADARDFNVIFTDRL